MYRTLKKVSLWGVKVKVKKPNQDVKFWNWGPKTISQNVSSAHFSSLKITPP